MEGQSDAQLELFNSSGGAATSAQRNPGFLKKIWGYEKALLLIIGALFIAIVSFSLGVEKGRALRQRAEGLYLIQAGSFTDRASARKEGEVIKKYGFVPLFFVRADRITLCAGNFSSLQAAKAALGQLSGRYKGCRIIRRQ